MDILYGIVNTLYRVLSWLPYIAGGTTVLYVILALLALAGLPFAIGIMAILKPWLVAASELIIGFIKTLGNGFVDMFDNWQSIVFVITIGVLAGYGGWQSKYCAPQSIASQRAPMKPGVVKQFTTSFKKAFTAAPLPAKKQVAPKAEPDTGLVKPFWEDGE